MSKKCPKYTELFGKKQAWEYSIVISFILNFVMILGVLFNQTGNEARVKALQEISWIDLGKYFLWHFLCNLILFYFLFRFNFRLIRSRLRSRQVPFSASLGTLCICFLLSPPLSQLQWLVLSGNVGYAAGKFFIYNLIKDFIVGLIIVIATRTIYSNYKREQVIIANQKLREENIRMRFEALKNQLDPHFLFNSLNTLNGLIGVDDDKAHDYVDNLSSVFRYTLNNKNIRTLAEEIGFVESYTALLQIRYGDNLTVEYDIDEKHKPYLIMPVSLQLLVENAVKHNVISNRSPLSIRIETTPQNTVIVTNRINPRAEKSLGSGVGLANLTERYAILFRRNINISDTDGAFSVEVPLIDETEENQREVQL